MRFLYYDRITAIEKGKSITGVKSFSLSEEFLRGHFRRKAVVPSVIFIEAVAQALGWLIIYSSDFRVSPILSLVEGVRVTPGLRPGFTAEIHGEIVSTSTRDTLGKGRVIVDGGEIATVNRIIYSHIGKPDPKALKQRFRYYSGMDIQGES